MCVLNLIWSIQEYEAETQFSVLKFTTERLKDFRSLIIVQTKTTNSMFLLHFF